MLFPHMKMVNTAISPCAMLFCRYMLLFYFTSLMYSAFVWSETTNPTTAVSDAALNGDTNNSPPPSKINSQPLVHSSTPLTNSSLFLKRLEHASAVNALSPEDLKKENDALSADSLKVRSETRPVNKSKTPVWYDTAGWLPKHGIRQDRSVNLIVLPMLVIFCFVLGVCLKCYSWVRDQDRIKARGQLDFEDDEINYEIITAGEQGYREVDIRSDCTSMYDTINSFRSLRLPINEHTVTSIKSLPPNTFETYRKLVLQKTKDGTVYDSVHSYKTFLERTMEMTEVDIEVELVDDYAPRPRSKSFSAEVTAAAAQKSRKRRLRRHSGGRSLEGNVRSQAEKERYRRHSENSKPRSNNPDSFQSKTFQRRSSPAILEPLFQGEEFRIPLELTEEEEEEEQDEKHPSAIPHSIIGRQSSNSSSSTGGSSQTSRQGREPSHKHRHGKHRRKRVSKERSAELLAKASSHSSGQCSDDSPRSSSSCKGSSSSNEIDSESDVTDSGLVVDLPKAEKSCFRNGKDRAGGNGLHRNSQKGDKREPRKVHRFKVSFVDEAALSAASE
ncbi:uncharacterized protein [Littorina saxatilis]|uniref:uncharacterized protein n=1 Tax=Littorina saxatilis TaxID=31220 RepID=UPI0038B5CA0C